MKKKISIVLNIVGLSPKLLEKTSLLPNITALKKEGTYRKMTPTFPAVTCSVQASLLTGKPPADHGIVGNGWFDRAGMQTQFWAQENALVRGPRIWDIMKERNPVSKIAVLFWQNSKYINADIVITPAPMHTDKGMFEWCYSKPTGYYEQVTQKLGTFSLKDYWGPLVSVKSSQWIAQAALQTLKQESPDMTLVYIPHLDYISQRQSPDSPAVEKDLGLADQILGKFLSFRDEYGKDDVVIFVVSEYGLTPVTGAVFPNRALRQAGLLKVREIAPAGQGGAEYIDFEQSSAFAVADHQIAHIYCKKNAIAETKKALGQVDGIDRVLDRSEQLELQIHHPRSGELIALAKPDKWFAYYYWDDNVKAPHYARTVDIHNKPGYDPVELFVDMKTMSIPLAPELVKGSHGLPARTTGVVQSGGPGRTDAHLAVMLCSDASLNDYAPEPFSATQFLGMLYRVI
ncbi:MAG: alkaline phosphatase family protein [Planctomycetes bacterium]|nr:alkaline phosphatase family protein [Planctomycetota bacterium]